MSQVAPKKRPGRPSTGQDLVPVCVMLRKEQVEWLKTFTGKPTRSKKLNSSSAVIRDLIDSVFAKK